MTSPSSQIAENETHGTSCLTTGRALLSAVKMRRFYVKRYWRHLTFLLLLVGSCVAIACSGTGSAEDTASVSSALCTAASITSDDPDYTAVPGQVVQWTATSSCSGTAQYQFWLRNPVTMTWQMRQDWSSSGAFTWDTTNQALGAWNVQAWVRDVASGSYQAYQGKYFTLASQPPCSAVSTAMSPPSGTGAVGTQVTFTSSASTCGTAEYQILHNAPGSGTWNIDSVYSAANANYTWDSTGAALGTHQFQVWARAQGSTTASYQAYSSKAFIISNGPACTGVATTVSPASGAATVGTQFTFTSAGTTCTSPEYQILHNAPDSGVWNIDSAYSASNANYIWNSTGAALGTHQFQVWVRAQGSTASYQAYAGRAITIVSGALCTSATLSFSPTGHAPVGTSVTIAATAAGCPSPTYRFSYLPPSGPPWQEINPFTTSSSAVWNTTLAQAGAYNVQVWVRNSGSPIEYEAYRGAVYTLDAATPAAALSVGGGFEQQCELLPSGKVGCWGYNSRGELGNASIPVGSTSKVPVEVAGITSGIALGVGYAHGCAVLAGGSVRCWGQNLHGQLGNGLTTNSSTPVSVSSITSAVAIGSGNSHNCVALSDGTVRCWGYNSQGQLGSGPLLDKYTPVTVAGISTARAVTGGYYHSCALLADQTVRCWGGNRDGALGDGSGVDSLAPVAVSGLTGVIALSSGSGNSCAVKSDGTIWCWGSNSQFGTLGNGSTAIQLSPVQVTGVTNASSVAVGPYHGCAGLSDGTAVCWGYNAHGQLGNNSTTNSLTPVPVSNLTTVKSLGVSQDGSCAILTNGTAACWGYGLLGQLGNNATADSSIPVAVTALP